MNRHLLQSSILLLFSIAVPLNGAADSLPDINRAVQDAGVPPRVSCDISSSAPSASPQEDMLKRWEDAGFKNAKIEIWSESTIFPAASPKSKNATHGIKLTIVLFRGANWTKDEVQVRFRRSAEVFLQCGIKIQQIEFIESDPPNGWIDIDYSNEKRDTKIAEMTPIGERPVYYYVRSSRDGQWAYSWHDIHQGIPAKLSNTAWITADVKSTEKSVYDSSYSVEAHELGHILADCEHDSTGEKNFLAGTVTLVNDKIRLDQCDAMKKSKLVKPL